MNFTFTTWNINTDPRVERLNPRITHPQWRSETRKYIVQASLPLSDIIHIQEGAKYTDQYGEKIDSITPLTDFLKTKGYNSSTQLLKPLCQYSVQFITAYKIERFELIENKYFYCTKTPYTLKKTTSEQEALEHNYDDISQRSVLITHLLDKYTGEDIWTINVHIGFSLIHRKHVSKMLVDFIKELKSDAKVIIGGDFNSFSDWGGDEALAILSESSQLTEASKDLKLPNGNSIDITFFAFPFDCITDKKDIKKKMADASSKQEVEIIFGEHCKAVGGKLDHIFSQNLEKIGNTVISVTPQYYPKPENYTEVEVKDYILAHHSEGPAFASDHQPLTSTFSYMTGCLIN